MAENTGIVWLFCELKCGQLFPHNVFPSTVHWGGRGSTVHWGGGRGGVAAVL